MDHLSDELTPITVDLSAVVGQQPINLVTRTFTIPASVPGFGFTSLAEWNAGAGDDQSTFFASWALLLDGAVVQSRTRLVWTADEFHSDSVFGGRNNLSAGSHAVILQVSFGIDAGSAQVFIFGAAMRTELVRANNLIVTP